MQERGRTGQEMAAGVVGEEVLCFLPMLTGLAGGLWWLKRLQSGVSVLLFFCFYARTLMLVFRK